MLIPEVQTHVHKREEKKETQSASSRGPAPCLVSLSGRKAHILKTWQGSQGSPGEGVIRILEKPVCQWQALLPGKWSWDGRGFQQRLLLRRKQGFDMFHVFPSCEPAPHGAQMQMYGLKMRSLEDCSCFREGCLKSPSSPFIPQLLSTCHL